MTFCSIINNDKTIKLVSVLLSSLLLTASFPVAFNSDNLIPEEVSAGLIWIAYVPLILALKRSTPKLSFFWAYIFGFISNGGILFWVIVAMQKYGNLSFMVSSSIMVLLLSFFALYPALSFLAIARMRGKAPSWLVAGLVFGLLDWSKNYFPFEGFPWTTPAYSLFGNLQIIQAADVIGTTGLNLVVMFSNFVLGDLIQAAAGGKKYPRISLFIILFMIVSLLVYGKFRIKQVVATQDKSSSLRIALIQGNIEQDIKWNERARAKILNTYHRLSLEAFREHPHLIVWPEAASPVALHREAKSLSFLNEDFGDTSIVIGAPTYETVRGIVDYRNSAFLLDSRGRVKLRYDKQHLVPFGEYVPFSDFLPMHYIVPPVAGNFSRGDIPTLGQVANHPFGILICYESLFPDLASDLVRSGAQFFVNITNDAWFDHTSGPFQHVRFGAFRAIENRRPFVRSANTGVSTWFDVLGKMHQPTQLFREAIVLADIFPQQEITFYTRYPNLVPYMAILLLFCCSLGFFHPKKKNHADAS